MTDAKFWTIKKFNARKIAWCAWNWMNNWPEQNHRMLEKNFPKIESYIMHVIVLLPFSSRQHNRIGSWKEWKKGKKRMPMWLSNELAFVNAQRWFRFSFLSLSHIFIKAMDFIELKSLFPSSDHFSFVIDNGFALISQRHWKQIWKMKKTSQEIRFSSVMRVWWVWETENVL